MIAAKHYLSVRDEDFEKAVGSAAQNPAHSMRGAQNPAQQPAASESMEKSVTPSIDAINEGLRNDANYCGTSQVLAKQEDSRGGIRTHTP